MILLWDHRLQNVATTNAALFINSLKPPTYKFHEIRHYEAVQFKICRFWPIKVIGAASFATVIYAFTAHTWNWNYLFKFIEHKYSALNSNRNELKITYSGPNDKKFQKLKRFSIDNTLSFFQVDWRLVYVKKIWRNFSAVYCPQKYRFWFVRGFPFVFRIIFV